eukprot:6483643-Amphidinium_carterae.2
MALTFTHSPCIAKNGVVNTARQGMVPHVRPLPFQAMHGLIEHSLLPQSHWLRTLVTALAIAL